MLAKAFFLKMSKNSYDELSEPRRANLYSGKCPSRPIFKTVTNTWSALILVLLIPGTHRYSDLRRKIDGISERMLAQSLKRLEADGFVNRKSYPVVPPHVEYSLTDLGQGIAPKVKDLIIWIEDNFPEIHQTQNQVAEQQAEEKANAAWPHEKGALS